MDFLTALTNSNTVQNVHAPLPLEAHIGFCVIATVVYAIQFARKKINYYLYLLIAINLTLVTQFFEQDYVIGAVAIVEIILLVMAFVSSRKAKKAQKLAQEKEKQREIMAEGEKASEALKNSGSIDDEPAQADDKTCEDGEE